MSDRKKPTVRDYQRLAAAMYQAAGCYDLPERFLDVLSCAQRREPFRHLLDGLLPCFESEREVVERGRESEPTKSVARIIMERDLAEARLREAEIRLSYISQLTPLLPCKDRPGWSRKIGIEEAMRRANAHLHSSEYRPPEIDRYRFICERISVTELQLILGRKPDPEPAYEVEIDAVVDAAMSK